MEIKWLKTEQRGKNNREHIASSFFANLWILLGLGIARIVLITRRLKKTIRQDFGMFVHKL